MPISAALAACLGSGRVHRRWSPYARPHEAGGGGIEDHRPPLRPNPASTRFLGAAQKAADELGRQSDVAAPFASAPGPAQKPVTIGPVRRSEVAPSVAVAPAAPSPRRPGPKSPSQNWTPISNPTRGDEKPPSEEKCGGGGFVFQCTLETGHTKAISGISLPLGSDKLYSGSDDGSVRVWDCNSGKCVDVIKMGGKIGCMTTHGPWVFIGVPKSVQAWNTQTGMKLSLQGPTCLVCSMTIMNDVLFAGTGDGRIMAWNLRPKEINAQPVVILCGHERPVISLSVFARSLFSSSLDKTIKVWDLTTMQCIQTLSEHKAVVTCVLCWDQKLLSCSLDKTVKVWNISESGALEIQYNHAEDHALLNLSSYLYYLAEGFLNRGLRTIFGMHRVGKTPILLCSLRNRNCIRLLNLPSFSQRGTLLCKNEVRTMELAEIGLLFTGDCAGELKVWRWAPQEEEVASASPPESAVQHH